MCFEIYFSTQFDNLRKKTFRKIIRDVTILKHNLVTCLRRYDATESHPNGGNLNALSRDSFQRFLLDYCQKLINSIWMKGNFLFYFLLFDFETQKTLNTWIWFWQANPVLTNNF